MLFDRRNCGASDVVIAGGQSESALWVEDLYELLCRLEALPAIIGGGSSGCRSAIVFALRHPEAVRALLPWRLTGGEIAATGLAEMVYREYIRAAEQGGMKAFRATGHFREAIEANPTNRERLMAMDAGKFIAVMSNWADYFLNYAGLPVIGASEDDLRSITVPT